MSSDEDNVKRMSELLRSGATMLFEHCPECNTPLFKVGDEVWCPKCNRRVIIVKEGKDVSVAETSALLGDVEKVVLTKVWESGQQISEEKDPARLRELGVALSTWLEVLERLRRIQRAS